MKIAICGYGNLGRGVECAVTAAKDMELFAVFTKRDPSTVHPHTDTPVYNIKDILKYKDEIDVLVLCAGSATDLPEMTPLLSKDFCVVDSFDTHAAIPTHFKNVDAAAKLGGKLSLISAGWDPGMFSINRLYASAVLPNGKDYTFWGKGVSQGHSDAVRRIDGVLDARQYTIPIESALKSVRRGESPEFTARQKHLRECFVVAEENADKARIENEIKTMPNYFADYDTIVHFISMDELKRDHSALPHGGFVIRTGETGYDGEHKHVIEYSLKLDSNPEFTASVIVSYARAVFKMYERGTRGCVTVFDVAPADLSPLSAEEIRATML